MKKRYYFITAIASYFLFLIATVPAKPFVELLNDDGIVLIQGISGTLWEGKARIIDIDNIAQLDHTKWSLSGWKILLGEIAIDIDTQYSNRALTAEVGSSFLGKIFINNLSTEITAENVAKLANIPIAQLSGLIYIDIEHAHWKQGELPLATGTINWKDATVTVAESASLGNITISLKESDDHFLTADIKNQGGDITISGDAKLIPEADYVINISLLPTATANNNIRQSLKLFAKKQSNGAYLINNKGSLDQIGLL